MLLNKLFMWGKKKAQHQGRLIMTIFLSFSLLSPFSYSVCLTLPNCRALSFALSLSLFLAVSLHSFSNSFSLSWFVCIVLFVFISLALPLSWTLCLFLFVFFFVLLFLFQFVSLEFSFYFWIFFIKIIEQHTYDSLSYLPYIHLWDKQIHLKDFQETQSHACDLQQHTYRLACDLQRM